MAEFVSKGSKADNGYSGWAEVGTRSGRAIGEARAAKEDANRALELANIQYGNSRVVDRNTPGARQVSGTDIWVVDTAGKGTGEGAKLRAEIIDEALSSTAKIVEQMQLTNPDIDVAEATREVFGSIIQAQGIPLSEVPSMWSSAQVLIEAQKSAPENTRATYDQDGNIVYSPIEPTGKGKGKGKGMGGARGTGEAARKLFKAIPKAAVGGVEKGHNIIQDFFGGLTGDYLGGQPVKPGTFTDVIKSQTSKLPISMPDVSEAWASPITPIPMPSQPGKIPQPVKMPQDASSFSDISDLSIIFEDPDGTRTPGPRIIY